MSRDVSFRSSSNVRVFLTIVSHGFQKFQCRLGVGLIDVGPKPVKNLDIFGISSFLNWPRQVPKQTSSASPESKLLFDHENDLGTLVRDFARFRRSIRDVGALPRKMLFTHVCCSWTFSRTTRKALNLADSRRKDFPPSLASITAFCHKFSSLQRVLTRLASPSKLSFLLKPPNGHPRSPFR